MHSRNILFPVAFSDSCAAAAPFVNVVARLVDAPVFLLHTLEDKGCGTESKAYANGALADLARSYFAGLTIVPVVMQGDPAREISAFAEARGIDLIMMPIHRAPESVTAKILDNSPCPLLTMPDAHPGEIRSLLCAIDLGPQSHPRIRAADSFGARTGAKVRLVHAVPGSDSGISNKSELEYERYLKDCARVAIARLQREAGNAFDICVHAGQPSRVIELAGRHHDADLAISGRGRNHAYSIIRDSHARC
jgi:nucleotide-binding universal stress UspA family protein